MQIIIRLFATLRERRGKELLKDYQEGISPRGVLGDLGIPEAEVAILLVNGRDGNLDQILEEGDTVSLFPPVGGG